jgi:prepilin-type N-terminal cleavage/methylation domain-containing protein
MAVPARGFVRVPRRTHRGGQGFTFYELLMVILVILILAAIAIPRAGSVVQQLRLRGAAWQLAGDLRLARQRAVTLRTRLRVCISGCAITVPSRAYSVEIDRGTPATPNWVSENGTTIALPPDVDIGTTATVTFAMTGMASGGTFTLSNTQGTYQVTVIPTGQVRVCRGDCP